MDTSYSVLWVLSIDLCAVALCSGHVTFGPDHVIFDHNILPDKSPHHHSSSNNMQEPYEEEPSSKEVISRKQNKGVHVNLKYSSEEETEGSDETNKHSIEETAAGHGISMEVEEETGAGHGITIGVGEETAEGPGKWSQLVADTKKDIKTFDTKTFLNGVSILTGFPDPEHCDILDAWACNAEQAKAVCPNRCATLAQAVDAPWCEKDKQDTLCNHHDARWMCPSFCAAIDARDCQLFEDWVCKSRKANKICPERCNNVNFTTDAPWCAQHEDDVGARWLCMNPDANQMCALFCMLHGYPLIGPNGLPMGIPPAFMGGIPGMAGMQGTFQAKEHPGMGSLPQFPDGTPRIAIPGMESEISNGISGIPSRIPVVVRTGELIGFHGGQKGFQDGQIGFQDSQKGFPSSQREFPRSPNSQTEFPGQIHGIVGTREFHGKLSVPGITGRLPGILRSGIESIQKIPDGIPEVVGELPGSHRSLPGGPTEFQGSQTGFPASQTGMSGIQTGFPVSQRKISGSQIGFPGSQKGILGSQTEISGSHTRMSESQTGFPGSQTGISGSQRGFQGNKAAYPGGGNYENGIDTGSYNPLTVV